MDHITNYYRNLAEQLQDRVNLLEGVLNELRAYTDEEREDEKLADRDIRAAKMLKGIAAKFNERTQDRDLTGDEQSFAERLKAMLQAKGVASDVSKDYYTVDGKEVYGIKGPITTIKPEEIKKYRPDTVKIEADTPMTMLGYNEKDRLQGEHNAEYFRKQKFEKLRAQQAKQAAEQKEAARIKKFTI